MKLSQQTHKVLTFLIASVWLINGLYCKVLNQVPRHKEIVSRILGDEYAGILTIGIGLGEIGMAIWILSGIKSKQNATIQIVLIAVMNIIEFIKVKDLLLFGRLNIVFAFLFIILIYTVNFRLPKNNNKINHA
jgi:uncharacterized membrane protein YphA (DoxX/SURF4 family)